MDLPIIDNSAAYVEVCKKAGLPINKVPKKGDKIELAYEMAMKEYTPHELNIKSPQSQRPFGGFSTICKSFRQKVTKSCTRRDPVFKRFGFLDQILVWECFKLRF